MGRYPREARDAQVKCIDCNAPVVTTVDGRYACVDCGGSPIATRDDGPPDRSTVAEPGTAVHAGGNRSLNND